jgi:glycosyltransferase involved in cell wall biosynthesis
MSARVAVLLPCHNEAIAIGDVVRAFRAALPDAIIYAYDNNSTDNTSDVARQAGAEVRTESQQGKGYVVRRMFADVDADIYVMADGDGTYEAADAPKMIALLQKEHLDMVVGKRVAAAPDAAWRRGHQLGNRFMTRFVARLFGERFEDIFSGYRVFSRRFVKSYPGLSAGFEIETELTVHALDLDLPVAEIDSAYKERPSGSASKLNTYTDGLRIGLIILILYKEVKPLRFFSALAVAMAITALILAEPLLMTYLETGLVPRFPTAILVTGIMVLSVIAFTSGLILDSVSRGRREAKRMAYLAVPRILTS